MTTLTSPTTAPRRPTHPLVTGPLAVLVFGAAMYAGEAFELNKGVDAVDPSATEWLVTGGVALVGLAIGIVVGLRAWNGDPARLSKYAVGLSIAAVVTFVAFWSGWPSVFSAVAVGLALEHRRRVGSFTPATGCAAGLGVVAFLATAYVCVTG